MIAEWGQTNLHDVVCKLMQNRVEIDQKERCKSHREVVLDQYTAALCHMQRKTHV